jgi:hypothetical protein
MLEIFLLIASLVWAIYVSRLVSFGVRSAKQLVASAELTNLNLCLIYHALPAEDKARSEAIMARIAPKFIEKVRRVEGSQSSRILKSLTVAAALVATLVPAKADPNALPAFRAITAYTLYRQVMLCEPAQIRHAEMLAKAIADRAKEDQPSLNLEQSWRLALMDPTGY